MTRLSRSVCRGLLRFGGGACGSSRHRGGTLRIGEAAGQDGAGGTDTAFERVIHRAGLEGWSVYCLRHYAITSWLRAGIPVHVVQRMAGHVHLSTTQRYVHFLKEDLDDAARKIAARGHPPSNSPTGAPA